MSEIVVRRVRWWRWLLAVVVLGYLTLYVAATWLRQHNTRRCYQAIAALEAQGFACSPQPASAVVDASAQADFWKRAIALAPVSREKPKRLQAWLDGIVPDAGSEAQTWITARRAEFDELLGVVQSGRIALSGASCPLPMLASLPVPAGMPQSQWRSEAMRVTWAMADWQRVEALLCEDPAEHLDALSRLASACAPPEGLTDLFMLMRLHETCDETMLELLRRRALPSAVVDAWLHDPTSASRLLADSWRGERIQAWPMSAWLITYGGDDQASLVDRLNPLGWWFLATLPDGEARRMVDLATFEAQASGRALPAVALGIGGASSVIYRIAMPNLMQTPISVAGFAQRAHMRRIAARVILLSRERGSLPLDQGDLGSWIDPALMLVGDDHGATTYVRTGAAGFVLTADATTSAKRLPADRSVKPLAIRIESIATDAP